MSAKNLKNHPPKGGALSFENTEIAFRHYTDTDLKRAYWLFRVINVNLLTQIGPPLTQLAMKIGLPVKGLIKATIFKHFCGGETIADSELAIAKLAAGKVGTILDYSVEGEEEELVFEETCAEVIRTIERAKGDSRIPLTVFKVTGIARFALLEKLDAKQVLDVEEKQEFERVKDRAKRICSRAAELEVPVMIDAEESWIQETIDKLALDMMRLYNRKQLLVYNTYQLYRHDKLADLKEDIATAKKEGFFLGAKLVRGANMEKERKRAAEMAYTSPIQPDKEHSDRDYDLAIRECVDQLDTVGFVAGTHNENSCRLLAGLLNEKGIEHQHPHVYFSQLLGMSDHLSFNLSDAGYNVAKYVPYGPVKAVLPYLFRRAQENTSIAGQMGRELALIIREKQRRGI